jgi:hypothetical protein
MSVCIYLFPGLMSYSHSVPIIIADTKRKLYYLELGGNGCKVCKGITSIHAWSK